MTTISDFKSHLQNHLQQPMQTKGTWINTMVANHYLTAESARNIANMV